MRGFLFVVAISSSPDAMSALCELGFYRSIGVLKLSRLFRALLLVRICLNRGRSGRWTLSVFSGVFCVWHCEIWVSGPVKRNAKEMVQAERGDNEQRFHQADPVCLASL